MTDRGHQYDDAAYVLGALSPEDRLDFERHLPGCDACAQSVRELAGLPGLLSRVPMGILDPEEVTPPVPDTLLPRLVRRTEQVRQRRRWVVAGLIAASVAAAVGIGAVGATTFTSHGSTVATAKAQQLTPVGAQPISGWVSLTPVSWGTRLDLTCTYATATNGYQPSAYSMFVTHADGTVEQVASWQALPGEATHVAGATAAPTTAITDVQVRDAAGKTVLDLGKPS